MNSVDKLIIWVSLKYPPVQQHNVPPHFLFEITASFNGFLSIQNLTRQMTKILKRKAITLVTRSAFVPYINKGSNRQFCEWLTRFVLWTILGLEQYTRLPEKTPSENNTPSRRGARNTTHVRAFRSTSSINYYITIIPSRHYIRPSSMLINNSSGFFHLSVTILSYLMW